ncbi:MAG: sensor histidine kinase [Desulfobacteraceae bacterium]|nr:sensor histidine kinase [Desulfobacteraceae bacterium]
MLKTGTILFVSFGYVGLLFVIAYYGDKRADAGRSIISNPYIYALSLAVYCTAWTFYGSVGLASRSGLTFLTIYIGPTLMAMLGWLVFRKIIRISKVHRITSIADFIASRYGKSSTLGGVVTIIAVAGVIPYIAVQIKAISTTFFLINQYPEISVLSTFIGIPVLGDSAFYVALMLAVFAILFGTRHLDAAERHEGLVAAIAFESIIKLVAFLAVGLFVTYGLYNGFADLFEKTRSFSDLKSALTIESSKPPYPFFEDLLSINAGGSTFIDWSMYIFLSMMAILLLPRQFQVIVVENVNEEHLKKAIWLFPLYLLAINIFVLPVAFAGMLQFADGGIDADTFVLTLPMAAKQQFLTLFVYLGGVSAATGMVIVETIALSTMICNDLVMPVLLRLPIPAISQGRELTGLLLTIRRGSIILVLMLGYAYFHYLGGFQALVSTGLIGFAAVAQFAPALIGGIFWKGGTRSGAIYGLIAGFMVLTYTIFLPSLVQIDVIHQDFVTGGPFGINLFKPYQLFGLQHFNPISHAAFWSLLFNVSVYIAVSILGRPRAIEHTQAALFVDVFKYSGETGDSLFRRGTVNLPDLKSLLARFLGRTKAEEELSGYAEKHDINWDNHTTADADLFSHAERLLTGAVGSASARIMVSSVVKEEPLGMEEVLNILDETRQVIAYSRELEKATADLKEANLRLQELDRLKDDFISTVTHELRTPLTSVRSLAEILSTNPGIDAAQLENFAGIIIKESDRLIRLVSQILDYEKIESAQMDWAVASLDLSEVVSDAVNSTRQLINDKNITIDLDLAPDVPRVSGDRDRLIQVMVNIISNAVKFCDPERGMIAVRLRAADNHLIVEVQDNGIGINPKDLDKIFLPFQQVKNPTQGRPGGTGIGLTITKRIIDFHHGRIWVESEPGRGSKFSFSLPINRAVSGH